MGQLLSRDPRALMLEQKRQLQRYVSQIEQECFRMGKQDERTIEEIREQARKQQMNRVRGLAKQLVRSQAQQRKLASFGSQLRDLSMQIQSAVASHQVATMMRDISNTMARMNSSINPVDLAASVQRFQSESLAADEQQKSLDSALQCTQSSEDAEEMEVESDQLVSQVLDQIGINLAQGLVDVPLSRIANAAPLLDRAALEEKLQKLA